jgi:hypothetical protein
MSILLMFVYLATTAVALQNEALDSPMESPPSTEVNGPNGALEDPSLNLPLSTEFNGPNGAVEDPSLNLPPSSELNGACVAAQDLPIYKKNSTMSVSGTYRIAADEATVQAVLKLTAAFKEMYPDAFFEVSVVGAAAAVSCLADNKCDWAIIGREMAPTTIELSLFRARFGYDPLEIPVMSGSVNATGYAAAGAVIVNKKLFDDRCVGDTVCCSSWRVHTTVSQLMFVYVCMCVCVCVLDGICGFVWTSPPPPQFLFIPGPT